MSNYASSSARPKSAFQIQHSRCMRYADRFQEYPRPMKTVYTLAESLAQDAGRVAKTQSLTLDSSPAVMYRPSAGRIAYLTSFPRHI